MENHQNNVYRVGDELEFCQIEDMFYIEGMFSWGGDEVAEAFNKNNEMQIEYLEDSIWRVTKEQNPQ